MRFGDYLRNKFGANWVLARRTGHIVSKYGEDVVCLSPEKYRAAAKAYHLEYGSPHDKARAALYLALKQLCTLHAKPCFQGDPFTYSPEWQAALDAIKAEQEAAC